MTTGRSATLLQVLSGRSERWRQSEFARAEDFDGRRSCLAAHDEALAVGIDHGFRKRFEVA